MALVEKCVICDDYEKGSTLILKCLIYRTANGNVEARVVCFYRRSEVSSSVLQQAEKNHWGSDVHADKNNDDPDSDDDDSVNEEKSEKAQLKQREVFLSRQTENLPATLIRGKCSVTLLSEVENAQSYLSRDDAFFYALVYDPHAKTLVADRGEIRIGSTYQVCTYQRYLALTQLSDPGTDA